MKSFFSICRVNVLSLALIAVGATVIVSCSKLDNDNDQNMPVAGLMAFNLAPDQQALALTLDGNSLTNFPLPYTNFTGGYVTVYPGNRTFQAFSSNSPSFQPLASATATFDPDKYYSVFTIGADSNYRNVIVHDNFDSLPGNGKAYIRYVNAIIDSTKPLTVVISAGGSDVVNQPASYAFVSEFVAITPGEVNIGISNNGGTDADRTITLEQNKVYTVLLTGLPGTTPASDLIRFITNGTLAEEPNTSRSAARSVAN